jgi:hypothetical protein
MDVIRLYQDYGIDFVTEGHKHSRPGWVNCECPFCSGNPGYHLGWNLRDEYFFCWRCGWHPAVKTISILLQQPEPEAKRVMRLYGVNRSLIGGHTKIESHPFRLPVGSEPLYKYHKKYLERRGFNPDELIRKWKLQATGPVGKLDGVDYRFRIIIPFFWNGQMVSFDSRDTTEKQIAKYKACPMARETIPHKQILYGNQEQWTPTGICVEGPTDVWRLGERAFAVSGIQYTHEQIRVISNTFKRVAIVFDDEPQAQNQARKLVADLRFRNVDAWNVEIKGDPGSMKQKDADELVKNLMK